MHTLTPATAQLIPYDGCTYVRVMAGQCVCELRMLSLSRQVLDQQFLHLLFTLIQTESLNRMPVWQLCYDLSDSKRNGVTRLQVLICTIEIITQPNGYIFNCCLTFTMMNKLTSWSRWLLFVETFLHTLDPQILSFIRLHVHTYLLLAEAISQKTSIVSWYSHHFHYQATYTYIHTHIHAIAISLAVARRSRPPGRAMMLVH